MIKLLVTDVDGTLLDANSEITPLNQQALFECQQKGIGIILATGKSIGAVLPIIELFGLKLPQITLSGSVTVDSSLNIIDAVTINPVYYYPLVQAIKKKGYIPLVARPDGKIFYETFDPVLDVFKKINEPILKTENIETEEFAQNCVAVSVPIKEDDPLDSYLRAQFSDRMQVVRSGEYFFDILDKKATKGNALNLICKKYGYNKEEVAVFGDSYNDISMFEFAGLTVAVKNSYPEVLKRADHITDSNKESGLAKAIYSLIL